MRIHIDIHLLDFNFLDNYYIIIKLKVTGESDMRAKLRDSESERKTERMKVRIEV